MGTDRDAVIAVRIKAMKDDLTELYLAAELLSPHMSPTEVEDLLCVLHKVELALKQGTPT